MLKVPKIGSVVTGVCKECGKEFDTIYLDKQYCDDRCAKKHGNRTYYQRRKARAEAEREAN